MKELYFENQGTSTFLVYKVKDTEELDSMSLGMLTNNNISGLSKALFMQMDSDKFIKFNVSSKVPVSKIFSGTVNKKRLIGVFNGICNAMLSAEDYMLVPTSILLDMNYIFTDASSCETDLICLPVEDADSDIVDYGNFFRNIMFNTQFDQTENCDFVAKIINYLNGTAQFSFKDFKEVLKDIDKTQSGYIRNAQQVKSVPMSAPDQMPAQDKTQAKAAQANVHIKAPETLQREGANNALISPAMKNDNGTEISFSYLMQHYSKENAANYKAQKEEKKKAAALAKEQNNSKKGKSKENAQSTAKNENFGFAIPGQASVTSPSVISTTEQRPMQEALPSGARSKTVHTIQLEMPLHMTTQVSQSDSMNFEDTSLLTSILVDENNTNFSGNAYFIRKKTGEQITLNKPVFCIGKGKNYADFLITDNIAISRSHAQIINREGKYFVKDMDSTNHTYINGVKLQSNQETLIEHSNIVKLADEDFLFKLY